MCVSLMPCLHRLGRKLSYLLKVLEDSQKAVCGLVETSVSPASGLYSWNLERLCSTMELGPGQVHEVFVIVTQSYAHCG